MLKEHKKKIIWSSLAILAPILVGVVLWNQLPDYMATHWGASGHVDGWTSKAFAVFGMPVMMLLIHWLCLWGTTKDPKQKNQGKKPFTMIFWMIPMVSMVAASIMYGTALGAELNIGSAVFAMLGVMFMVIGNYMPKVKQNYTLGIKVVWALHNEENWNATHRFGGKVWVAGGALLFLLAFFPEKFFVAAVLPVIFALAAAPMVYSWLYYKKQCARGEGYPLDDQPEDSAMKKMKKVSVVIVSLILLGCVIIMCSGSVEYRFDEKNFTIEPTFWNKLTVEYDAIESIELRKETVEGTREYGFGSAKLLLGVFENEEFGIYTRYTYLKSDSAVVLTVNGNTLVIAGETTAETDAIYQELLSRMEG